MNRHNAKSPREAAACCSSRRLGDQSLPFEHTPIPASTIHRVETYLAAARAPSTRKGYTRDFHRFSSWCALHGVTALPAPPEAVALYLTHRAEEGARPATIARSLAAIAEAHRAGGHPNPRANPSVAKILSGIRRTHGVRPVQKDPLSVSQLRLLLPAGNSLRELRDRAILLLGWAGAFRRSELVALDIRDITTEPEGLRVQVRRSKTDQEGIGMEKGIPYGSGQETCPVLAVQGWVRAAGLTEGPLFRRIRVGERVGNRLSDHAIAGVIKKYAAGAGLNPANLSGHSLRAGFATEAARRGRPDHEIMKQTGHRSHTVLHTYIRRASIWDGNAAGGLL